MMKNYIVKYKKYNDIKQIRIVAKNITKALEFGIKYLDKNEYGPTVVEVIYENEIAAVQK